ncbi:hypothetical protein TNIN_483581 [Trichonephila inaurata madagascariensis]|uniref:Uncharacterized protein n=1 Tax=Trichonephila inaurata madagascariensis TaxID=2747483 RepID=A0A8X6XTY3_9ARAC|nr:hypothetical protein TNIN_483581 [Trichonephila inaurata madagascariensis]
MDHILLHQKPSTIGVNRCSSSALLRNVHKASAGSRQEICLSNPFDEHYHSEKTGGQWYPCGDEGYSSIGN